MSDREESAISADDRKALDAFHEYLHVELGEKQPRTMATLTAVANYLTHLRKIRPREYNDGNPSSFVRLRRLINEEMDNDETLATTAREYMAQLSPSIPPAASFPDAEPEPTHAERHGKKKKRTKGGKKSAADDGVIMDYKSDLETSLLETVGQTVTDAELDKAMEGGTARVEPYDTLVDQYVTAVVAVARDKGSVKQVGTLGKAREALKKEILPRIQHEEDKPALEPMLKRFEDTVIRELSPGARRGK